MASTKNSLSSLYGGSNVRNLMTFQINHFSQIIESSEDRAGSIICFGEGSASSISTHALVFFYLKGALPELAEIIEEEIN